MKLLMHFFTLLSKAELQNVDSNIKNKKDSTLYDKNKVWYLIWFNIVLNINHSKPANHLFEQYYIRDHWLVTGKTNPVRKVQTLNN